MDTLPTIVVGGGLAGLTAAATLARDGRSVVVIEGASQLGGRARTRHHDGFDLNLGPHALYIGGERVPCCATSASAHRAGVLASIAPASSPANRSCRRCGSCSARCASVGG
ncbi:MAG: FAD/NAD(P)-binding protein [Ilumatobacteraceae bacterium]